MAPRQVGIHRATAKDAGEILRMIRELADYEGLLSEVRATEEDILRDGFGDNPRFSCLLARLDGEVVGFALYFHNYSTFEGRAGLYVEDLFVAERARGFGVGRALLARLAEIAAENSSPRIDLSVLHWNPARQFYNTLGFQQLEDWQPFRLSGEALAHLASGNRQSDNG